MFFNTDLIWIYFQRVLDVDTYIFNLTDANLSRDKQPEYFKLYNHRNDLEMENLFPADFDELAHRMKTDDETYSKFFRYQKHIHNYFSIMVFLQIRSLIYIEIFLGILTLIHSEKILTGELQSAKWFQVSLLTIGNAKKSWDKKLHRHQLVEETSITFS